MVWALFLPILSSADAILDKQSLIDGPVEPSKDILQPSIGALPVYFEENRGQFDDKAKYFARGTNGFDLFLTATDAVYVVAQKQQEHKEQAQYSKLDALKAVDRTPRSATAVYMTLVDANEQAESTGSQQLEHRTNYFKGEESNWRTDIPNYGQVRIADVYQGIDTVWYGRENGGVQYDFVVAPNADPGQIKWEVKGAQSVELDAEGSLIIKTEYGDIKQNKPYTYQEIDGLRQEIESRFVLETETTGIRDPRSAIVKFYLGGYDPSKPLVIDPSVNLSTLGFSTFLGGTGSEQGHAIAVDNAGDVYVTGETDLPGFPTTPGTFDPTYNGLDDVFVTKINAAGTALLFSTFIGGNSEDVSFGIAVDSSGNALVTGYTFGGSLVYPTTAGAFDMTHNGTSDVFVTKLDAAGSALLYSTFIGGSENEVGEGIAIDPAGNAFITGNTSGGASAYPTTAGAFDTTHNGSNDVFVTKLNAAGSDLLYSTFIGGSSTESGNGIAIDPSGNAFIAGTTLGGSPAYPTTAGAFDTTHNDSFDVFVTKLNAAGSDLHYSTFIGGNFQDNGRGIAIDSSGNAFVTGHTEGGDPSYPTTAGAFATTHSGVTDVFVTKLNAAGSDLLYSTFIGESDTDEAFDIAVDPSGNTFITGYTTSPAYPTTAGAFDTTHNGGLDVFVTKLNPAGSALLDSTFIGGSSNDFGFSIAIDPSGNALITGNTGGGTPAYPTTDGAFDTTFGGFDDVIVTKLGNGVTTTPTPTPTPTPAGCSTVVVNTDDSGIGSLREAISCSNMTLGVQTISFNIPGSGVQTIAPLSALPPIKDTAMIDGYTQPGSVVNNGSVGPINSTPLIELNGQNAGQSHGIDVFGSGTTIRGLVINRFAQLGIYLREFADNCIVSGNFIGTDPAGNMQSANGGAGIYIESANNLIGGGSDAARNLISGNLHNIEVVGTSATGNQIKGNFIGTNITGTASLNTTSTGIFFRAGAGGATVGGPVPGERNLISGNSFSGIWLEDSRGSTISGNFIGTDITGSLALPNGRGFTIGGAGVTSNNFIGGLTPGERNIVSGNTGEGFRIFDPGTTNNVIAGNFVGTAVNGIDPLGNGLSGIDFRSSPASGNTIGGTVPGTGNLFAFNGGHGILMQNGSSNRMQGNSIHSNALLGIDLNGDGVSANDPGDADAGSNNLQNYPVLNTAAPVGGGGVGTEIQGTLNSSSNAQFRIEFFSSTTCDPSGNGEGQTYLGFTNVTTVGTDAVINTVVPTAVSAGNFITATATNPSSDTSEFSACLMVGGATGFENDVTPRANGDGIVISGDVIQMRRFATGLDTPALDPNEYQRADSAPRATFGDGIVNSGDVIQARRYATGLDPATPAAGPTGPPIGPNAITSMFEDVYAYFFGREIRVVQQKPTDDGRVTVTVEITPYGDEVAAGFTLEYDAGKLSNPQVTLAEDAPQGAVLTTNTNVEGKIAVLVDSTEAFMASAVPKRFLIVTFDAVKGAVGETAVVLTNSLVNKATSDVNGNTVRVRYVDGVIKLSR
ncbi:MAG: beta strand repeat-containing protein [Pyrinomonadaceae bacterium]